MKHESLCWSANTRVSMERVTYEFVVIVTGCSIEDLQEVISNRDVWCERGRESMISVLSSLTLCPPVPGRVIPKTKNGT